MAHAMLLDANTPMIEVRELMSTKPYSCRLTDTLNDAAQLMWEHDCGSIPIVDHLDRVVGIVTDRDICMGAYTQGRPLAEIPLASVCTREVYACLPNDPLEKAEGAMIDHQIRRLPVTDRDGYLLGMLSLSDIARHLHLFMSHTSNGTSPRALSLVMAAVSRRRDVAPRKAPEPKRTSPPPRATRRASSVA